MKGTSKKVREASGESENTKEGRKIKVMKESYRCQKKVKEENKSGEKERQEKTRRKEKKR